MREEVVPRGQDKKKKKLEKLESQMTVDSLDIATTNAEIIKIRETELYPLLIELVKKDLVKRPPLLIPPVREDSLWRTSLVSDRSACFVCLRLTLLRLRSHYRPSSSCNISGIAGFPLPVPSPHSWFQSLLYWQSTLQVEVEIQQWHQSFCNLVKAHRNYIQSFTAWLRLSLFQFSSNPLSITIEESKIYTLYEERNPAIDCILDKVKCEGIKTLLTAIHAIMIQQMEEHRQKKKLDAALKELEKKVVHLQLIKCKHGSYSMLESSDAIGTKDHVTKKSAKVEHLRTKVEEEKMKDEKLIRVTREMTQKNPQKGFPQVFSGDCGVFKCVCVEGNGCSPI
ncbi:hypothetical protein E2542_SST20357 [Spatholobus suberectus]|nr:hypothetical protein E2542_SST20357 [Spatholobus suberectus]